MHVAAVVLRDDICLVDLIAGCAGVSTAWVFCSNTGLLSVEVTCYISVVRQTVHPVVPAWRSCWRACHRCCQLAGVSVAVPHKR